METRHRCKLCFRNFANGRALGGHMRSHMMKFYAAEKASNEEEEEERQQFDDFQSVYSYSSPSPSPSSSSSSSSEDEEQEEEDEVKALLSYELRENPQKSALFADHEFSVVLQDRESETESSKKNPICRRSKRVRKSRVSDFNNGFGFDFETKKSKFENNINEYSSLSSISDTTPEEHVAHCLIMLSKDKWKREEIVEYQGDEDEEEEQKKKSEDDNSKVTKSTSKVRGKYRCEACNKLFKSYQALGGHRASHKKVKAAAPPRAAEKRVVAKEKVHECPFCHRVFSSGQALGGHKRSHFIGGGAISANIVNISDSIVKKQQSRMNNGEALNIDLNLPAPVDDDETTSQIAVSAVSDAEFVAPH